MVNLLALEYEEENLSEEKKRSLSAEVYSLQLVVDMRTGEVRNLRDQVATLTHHLEIMHDVQTKLDKANNRIEDLQEQLKLKVQSEQLLSAQRDQLETTVSNSSREVERMSQNVEELQWRIRNNYELPVEIVSPTSQRPTQLRFDRLTRTDVEEIPAAPRQSQQDNSSQVQSTEQSETEEKKNSLFSVGQEMLEATTTDVAQKSPATTSDYSSTSSNSPNSDLYLEEDIKLQEDKEQVEENNNIHHEEGNIDSDSLDDEGLGDISSEGENAESPLPSESSGPTNCLGEIVNTSCEPPAGAKTSTKSEELSSKLYHQDTEKERRPSRISFETPL